MLFSKGYNIEVFLNFIEKEVELGSAISYIEEKFTKFITSSDVTLNDKIAVVQKLSNMKVQSGITAKSVIIENPEWYNIAKLIKDHLPPGEEINKLEKETDGYDYEKVKELFLKRDLDSFISELKKILVSIEETAQIDIMKAVRISKTMFDQFSPLRCEFEVNVKDLLLQMDSYNEFQELLKDRKIM